MARKKKGIDLGAGEAAGTEAVGSSEVPVAPEVHDSSLVGKFIGGKAIVSCVVDVAEDGTILAWTVEDSDLAKFRLSGAEVKDYVTDNKQG